LSQSFVDGLSKLGYVEGRNLTIEWRYPVGDREKANAMAAELVGLGVDVIVANSNVEAAAAKRATSTIPIVALLTHDGVGTGLYRSLANPGGNITGIESLAPELDVKRVGFLKDFVPSLSKVAALHNPSFPGSAIHLAALSAAAKRFGAEVKQFGVKDESEFQPAFSEIRRDQPDALIIVTDPLIFALRALIIAFAKKMKLPNAYEFKAFAEDGGLFSYGASIEAIWRRGAYYVDKILKGSNPGDLPVELPTAFELVVNRTAAVELGLRIPDSVLATADLIVD
jgi:putative ABC transport system substrate-binding protein